MTDFAKSLRFYFEHWDDMAALDEMKSCPPGVQQEEWGKFQSVSKAATRNVEEILRELSNQLSRELPYKSSSKPKTIKRDWCLTGRLTFKESGIGTLMIALDQNIDTKKPIVALCFQFDSNGRQKAEAFIERTGKRWHQEPCFAHKNMKGWDRWTILLRSWIVDQDTTVSQVQEGVEKSANLIRDLQDEFVEINKQG